MLKTLHNQRKAWRVLRDAFEKLPKSSQDATLPFISISYDTYAFLQAYRGLESVDRKMRELRIYASMKVAGGDYYVVDADERLEVFYNEDLDHFCNRDLLYRTINKNNFTDYLDNVVQFWHPKEKKWIQAEILWDNTGVPLRVRAVNTNTHYMTSDLRAIVYDGRKLRGA